MKPEIPVTVSRVFKKGVRIVSSGVLFVSSIVSPVDSPIKVSAAEDKCHEIVGHGFTALAGDCNPNDLTFGVFLDTRNGATVDMAQRLARAAMQYSPAGFPEKMTILLRNPEETGDLGCNFDVGTCDGPSLIREVDIGNSLLKSVGRAIHEPIELSKSKYEHGDSTSALLEGRIPTVYTGSKLFLRNPKNPEQSPTLNQEYARAFIHENWGHGVGDIDDNEGHRDVMDHGTQTIEFSLQHLQRIRGRLDVGVHRYTTPSTESKILNAAGVLSGQVIQTPDDMSLVLGVYAPVGTTQFLSMVIPYNNDGAGVFDYAGTPLAIHSWGETGRKIPPPPQWYGLLPDMSYTWTVKTTGVTEPIMDKNGNVILDDPRWGKIQTDPGVFVEVPGAESIRKFRTPKRDSSGIGLVTLAGGQETNNRTPTLIWNNRDSDVFYYEVQVSKDAEFGENGPKAMVYHELRHGGVTNPNNSYTIPDNFPLEKDTKYYWRVRPRVQGDGTPVAWSNIGSLKTSQDARVLSEGELEVITQAKKFTVEEHLRLQEEIRKEEQEHNQPTALHWRRVNQKVLEDRAAVHLNSILSTGTSWLFLAKRAKPKL